MEHVSLELTIYFENGFYYDLFEQEKAQGHGSRARTFCPWMHRAGQGVRWLRQKRHPGGSGKPDLR